MRTLGCEMPLRRGFGQHGSKGVGQIYPDLPPYTELAPALGSGLGKAVYFLT